MILLAQERAKEMLRSKTSFVFNATNTTKDIRGKWISLFAKYGAKVGTLYLEVSYKQMIRQNANREHKVPESVIEKLLGKLEIPTPNEAHELEFIVES